MMENFFTYIATTPLETDGTNVSSVLMGMKPASRGTISITSKNPAELPIIDPDYLDTEVDRYVWGTSLHNIASMTTGGKTVLSREIIAIKIPSDGFAPLSPDAADEYLDARVKAAAM